MSASELDALWDDGSGVGARASHLRDDASDQPSSKASKSKPKAKVRATKRDAEHMSSRFSNWGLVPDPRLN